MFAALIDMLVFPSFFVVSEGFNEAFSAYDTILGDEEEPVVGSVVYCKLAGRLEHSGIYVGNGKIVHLNGDGLVEKVSGQEFCDRLGGWNPAVTIWYSKVVGGIEGNQEVADRALSYVGRRNDYNILLDNCHCFTAKCLSGEEEFTPSFSLLNVLTRRMF